MNVKKPVQIKFRLSEEEAAILKDDIAKSGLNQQKYLYKRLFENKSGESEMSQKTKEKHEI